MLSEDEAAELLLSNRAHQFYGEAWRIAEGPLSPYGDTYRDATPEEAETLDRVKLTLSGNGSEVGFATGATTGGENLEEPPSTGVLDPYWG